MIENKITMNRIKKSTIRNINSTIVRYILTVIGFGAIIVSLGFTTSPFSYFIYLLTYMIGFSLVAIVYVHTRTHFDFEDSKKIAFILGLNWCIGFVIWLPMLGEARPGALMLSLGIISYYYRYGNLLLSIFSCGIIVLLYVAGCSISHFYLNQPGDIVYDLYIIAAFIPVSLLLISVGTQYSQQKYKLTKLVKQQANLYSKLSKAHTELELVATTDELTRLANRREMNNRLTYEFDRIKRSKEPLSVLIMDLDNFKSVNDRYGHSFGDFILKEFADVLKNNLRSTDYIARWGGEEFLVLMPNTNGQQAKYKAEELARKVREREFTQEDQSVTITVSGGVAEVNANLSIEELINLADSYLYKAKSAGRNRVFGG